VDRRGEGGGCSAGMNHATNLGQREKTRARCARRKPAHAAVRRHG
jgi:hypothetical protein